MRKASGPRLLSNIDIQGPLAHGSLVYYFSFLWFCFIGIWTWTGTTALQHGVHFVLTPPHWSIASRLHSLNLFSFCFRYSSGVAILKIPTFFSYPTSNVDPNYNRGPVYTRASGPRTAPRSVGSILNTRPCVPLSLVQLHSS